MGAQAKAHVVHFYERDSDLVDVIVADLVDAWRAVAAPGHAAALHEICGLHSEVFHAPATVEAQRVVQEFAPGVDAPRAARRFVVDVLRGWGRDDLVVDAAIVLTELATNAVLHAQ